MATINRIAELSRLWQMAGGGRRRAGRGRGSDTRTTSTGDGEGRTGGSRSTEDGPGGKGGTGRTGEYRSTMVDDSIGNEGRFSESARLGWGRGSDAWTIINSHVSAEG
jgi:hypothetical protein